MSTIPASSASMHDSNSAQQSARRELRYSSLPEILDDIETLTAGPVRSVGSWTPAQNIEHVRLLIRVSREGAEFSLPLRLRILAKLFKPVFLARGLKPGIKGVPAMEPSIDINLSDAVSAFREEILAAARPGAMAKPSPLFGPMSHDDWVRLHCRHAELHFSHLVPGESE